MLQLSKIKKSARMPIVLFLLIAGTSTIFVFVNKTENSSRDEFYKVQLGDQERRYLVHIPLSYDQRNKTPVVIVLHAGGGYGGTAKGMMAMTGFAEKSDEAGFLTVFPEGTLLNPEKPFELKGNIQAWNDGSNRYFLPERKINDVTFINSLIDDLQSRFNIDGNRIFITGFSNGASMTFRLGIELANRIAAIAPVAGALYTNNLKLEKPVSLLFIVGSEDKVPPTGKTKIEGREVDVTQFNQNPIKTWAKMLNCPPGPRLISTNFVGTEVSGGYLGPCENNSEILAYYISGLGHVWPGDRTLAENLPVKEVNATAIIWDFFKEHPKRQ